MRAEKSSYLKDDSGLVDAGGEADERFRREGLHLVPVPGPVESDLLCEGDLHARQW